MASAKPSSTASLSPRHRDEDAPTARDLHDQADGPGLGPVGGEDHHDIADAADLVAERVEDAQAGQARDEDAGAGTHNG